MLELCLTMDKCYQLQKLPKGFSLSDFRALEDVYNELLKNKLSFFINGKVFLLLNKLNGLSVQPCGIGWLATY